MSGDAGNPIPTVRDVASLRDAIGARRGRGGRIGLVPTMGALHAGHLRLVEQARETCDHVVASIFVNPKQFDRRADLAHYPRDEAGDAARLAEAGCGLLYAPPLERMYPAGFATTVQVGGVAADLEGEYRPGHFEGVATVVTKLLLQVLPDAAFFGEKDFQQLLTIRRLAADLDIPVAVEGVPTARESDGLALSSRNARLTPDQRRVAPVLADTLMRTARHVQEASGPTEPILQAARESLLRAGFDAVDYVALRDAGHFDDYRPPRLLAAAWLGDVRLIDNVPVA